MTLTAKDRCDACYVAAAQVRVHAHGSDFDLCHHHYGVHEAALAVAGADVLVDVRHRLVESVEKAKTEGVS